MAVTRRNDDLDGWRAHDLGDPVYRDAVDRLTAMFAEASPTGRYVVLVEERAPGREVAFSVHGDPTGRDAAIDAAAGLVSGYAADVGAGRLVMRVVPWLPASPP